MPSKEIAGYIILTRIPELSIEYPQCQDLASDTGLPLTYTPDPPKRRNAWEKATNLKRGKKLDAPQALAAQIERKYGVTPRVRLETKIVSRSQPKLIRHIVRTVTVPHTDTSTAKDKLAERQLRQDTVCIMEFDCETEAYTSTGYQELHDKDGWVNGELKVTVQSLHDNVRTALDFADSQDVRNKMRLFLDDNKATLMSAGGAYFIPYSDDAFARLKSAKAYIEGLTQYVVKRNPDGSPAERATFTVIPMTKDGESFEARLDVAHNAVEQFKSELQALVDDLQPVIAGGRTEKVSDNIRSRATIKFMELNQTIASYREALDDNLRALDVHLDSTSEFIAKAQTVTAYKPLKSQDESQGESQKSD